MSGEWWPMICLHRELIIVRSQLRTTQNRNNHVQKMSACIYLYCGRWPVNVDTLEPRIDNNYPPQNAACGWHYWPNITTFVVYIMLTYSSSVKSVTRYVELCAIHSHKLSCHRGPFFVVAVVYHPPSCTQIINLVSYLYIFCDRSEINPRN